MNQQLNLLEEKTTMISIDESKNRFRAYQVEFNKIEGRIVKKWGRIQKKGGHWMLRHNKWQQEVEIGKDVGDKELENIYRGILKTREKHGYNYYLRKLFV